MYSTMYVLIAMHEVRANQSDVPVFPLVDAFNFVRALIYIVT